jgi:hypothetical protein
MSSLFSTLLFSFLSGYEVDLYTLCSRILAHFHQHLSPVWARITHFFPTTNFISLTHPPD